MFCIESVGKGIVYVVMINLWKLKSMAYYSYIANLCSRHVSNSFLEFTNFHNCLSRTIGIVVSIIVDSVVVHCCSVFALK